MTREYIAIDADQSLTGKNVEQTLMRIAAEHSTVLRRIQADNGPEVVSLSLDNWADDNGVTLDYSRLGKPLIIHSSNPSTAVYAMSV